MIFLDFLFLQLLFKISLPSGKSKFKNGRLGTRKFKIYFLVAMNLFLTLLQRNGCKLKHNKIYNMHDTLMRLKHMKEFEGFCLIRAIKYLESRDDTHISNIEGQSLL